MLIFKDILQNLLLAYPAIKQLAWKWHSTGIMLTDLTTLCKGLRTGKVVRSKLN